MRALIADDDAVSRLMLQRALEKLGHEVLVATNGADAWELYRRHTVDVIVSDWLMPGMDGLDLCRRVRESQRETYTYFMLLTSLEGKQHFMQGMQAGADDYLPKPLDREELQVRLQVASRVTSLHHQLAEKTRELETANRALAESARRDPLTGLGNRLQLREDLNRLQRWLNRYRRSFGVALCDVDRFKLYNDRYGHVAGDEVLQAISTSVAKTIRSGDMAYRYGGEEILVIMPEQSAETSIIAMERVREAVARLAIAHLPNRPYGVVTISVGLVAVGQGEQLPWEAVLNRADAALYRAKAEGRNRLAIGGLAPVGLAPNPNVMLGIGTGADPATDDDPTSP
jgi:diguanylate cyclase (GGDEF)-like protein